MTIEQELEELHQRAQMFSRTRPWHVRVKLRMQDTLHGIVRNVTGFYVAARTGTTGRWAVDFLRTKLLSVCRADHVEVEHIQAQAYYDLEQRRWVFAM